MGETKNNTAENTAHNAATCGMGRRPGMHSLPEAIGEYRIREELGYGTTSDVYLAEAADGRRIALKVQNIKAFDKPWAARRFVCETEIVALFDHPSIVRLVGAGVLLDGRGFLAMELVSGITLDKRLGASGMATEDVERLAPEICEAVAAIHDAGVVHCDLKPQNIMLDYSNRIRLIDFGLARRLGSDDGSLMPKGTIAGTPKFMSPEQILAADLDARSDVFALGCLLYTLLNGRSPFRRRSIRGMFKAVLKEPAEDIRLVRPEVSPRLAEVIHKALTKERRHRYRNAGEMLEALGVERRYPTVTTPAAEPLQATAPRRSALPDPVSTDSKATKMARLPALRLAVAGAAAASMTWAADGLSWWLQT